MSYTDMSEKPYMSQIMKYKKIPLGRTEVLFLYLISKGDKSAYEILSFLREIPSKSMSYKNVHERVKRLQTLRLIEPTKEKLPRNAIKYRLTAYGLFQCILVSSDMELTNGKFVQVPASVLDPRIKKESPILRTILYRYFEEETIKPFLKSILMSQILEDYLRETCESILRELEKWKSKWKSTKIKCIDNHSYYGSGGLGDRMDNIDKLIEDRAKNFIYKLVVFSRGTKGLFEAEGNITSIPGTRLEDRVSVINALAKDKKFIELLKKVKDEFTTGCDEFL